MKKLDGISEQKDALIDSECLCYVCVIVKVPQRAVCWFLYRWLKSAVGRRGKREKKLMVIANLRAKKEENARKAM